MKPVEIEFLAVNNTKTGLSGVSSGVDAVQQDAEQAQAVISALREEVVRLQQQMKDTPTLDQSESIAMIDALNTKIKELEAELEKAGAAIPKFAEPIENTKLTPKDLPNARRSFNGLNFSIQQIAREMPTLAMGPQMFFLAISNNLPIFADELGRARKEYDLLVASGQKGVPVWKQILSSIFSWQTAMTAAIMLTVMYGKEIGNWVKGMFSATDAIEQNKEAIARKIEVEKEANAEALKTRSRIQNAIAELERFTGSKEEERRKIEELNSKYGEAFGYYRSLSDWYDVLCAKAEDYIRIMFMQAKAQSLISAAVKADEKAHEIEANGQEEFRPFWGPGGKAFMFFGGGKQNQYGSDPAELAYKKAIKEQQDIRDTALQDAEFYQNQMARLRKGNDLDAIVTGSVEDLENAIALKRKALKKITNKDDYEAAIEEIKGYEDQLEAITGGSSAKNKGKAEESGRGFERLSDMEVAARQRVEEQVVALMKEGYDKQRAEAELNFKKEKDRITKEEQERLALIEKLRKSGAKIDPAAEATIRAQAATQRVQAAQLWDNQLTAIDNKETDDDRKRLEKLLDPYKDYAQKREDIIKKYGDDLKALHSNYSKVKMDSLGDQMRGMFNGNVDLLARPVIDAAKLAEKGWKDAGEGIATVFSSQFGIDDAAGKSHEILVTPILPDGTVLSEDELRSYVDNVLSDSDNILAADIKGIVIGVDVDPDGSAGEKLHQLQQQFYNLKLNPQANAEADNAIRRAIFMAMQAEKEALNSLDRDISSTAKKGSKMLTTLFRNASTQSKTEIESAIDYAQKLVGLLNGTQTNDKLGFTDEQIVAMKKDTDLIESLLQGIIDKKDELFNRGSVGSRFFKSFKQIKDALSEKDAEKRTEGLNKGIGDMLEAGQAISQVFGDIAGKLTQIAELSGDEHLASFAYTLQSVSDTMSTTFQGAMAGGMLGGPIGAGIGAAVGGLLSIFSIAAAANARHKVAMKEIEQAKLNFQYAYNLALLKQNLLLEEASNIFGERQITKAANAMQNYRNALSQFNQEMNGNAPTQNWIERLTGDAFGSYAKKIEQYKQGIYGLASAEIVTGHKKTGLFGWGRGKDLYSSILSAYPELIDANGELDTAMLQTILDTRKMSDETRVYLENLINLKDAMNEAEKALENFLQQTFGSLGQNILDSITTALKGGDAAMEAFADKAASVFEKLGEQVAYSLFFADKFDQLEEQLKGVYGSGKSEEEIANDAMRLIDSFYDSIGSNVDTAQKWMEEWKKKAEEMGFDLWKDDGTTQSGRSGAFQSLSQEQGTKLEGLMTSLQMHAVSLDEKTDNITAGLGGCLDMLSKITENTKALPMMLAIWETIKRDGLKIR